MELGKNAKIKTYTDLLVWQEGHKLVLEIYKCTKIFPKEEMFGLTSQMRRAVVSVTSNIAEGFNRQTLKDKINFYYNSRGSLMEVQNQIIIAKDIDFLNKDNFENLLGITIQVSKLLNGLIKSCLRLVNGD